MAPDMHTTGLVAGWNPRGQLGSATATGFSATPATVSIGIAFRQITAGYDHTCGINATGHAFCWGEGPL